jgi:predicted Zn finger-like uncharacterized protein
MTAALPGPPCPECQSTSTRLLEEQSAADDEFDYFRCEACAHRWMALSASAGVRRPEAIP